MEKISYLNGRSCNGLLYLLLFGFIIIIGLAAHPLGLEHYGYDYGFYAYAVQHTPLDSPKYFAGQVNDYGNHVFVVLNWLRLPQLPTLHILFMSFYGLSGILLYKMLAKHDKIAALTGVALFAFSVAQTQSYTMFLWKAAYGQMLLLATYLLIQKKKFYWEFLPVIIIAITHKTTAIMAMASLLPYYVLEPAKRRILVLSALGIISIIILFALNGYNYILQLVNSDVENGQFFNIAQYLRYTWYLIPAASFGIYQSVKSRTHLPWLSLLAVSILFILFKIAFHERLIMYADLALVFFAALTIAALKFNKHFQLVAAILLILLAMGNFLAFTKHHANPRITETEIEELRQFSRSHQGAFVVALSAQDAPWLLANLGGNIRLAAPGLFEDKKSRTEWEHFWLQPKNSAFLNSYPQPLFLYHRSSRLYPNSWECLQKISAHFFKYTCQK